MIRKVMMASAAAWVLASASAQAQTGAVAQDAAADRSSSSEEASAEVVVTGSYIRGSAENAALPVDVIGERELAQRGQPSTLELIKALPVSSGVLGDSNQFDGRAQGAEGSGSINLRGLGPERTLVLLNGRRLTFNPTPATAGGVVDTNLLPAAAIGRVEVLKDGAAALYGSDAVAGVVNFITRENQSGFVASADYKFVRGSDGDYNFAGSWGGRFGDLKLFGAAGYQHRSELRVTDRDFANPDYLENPQGGYTAVSNPGTYVPLGATYSPIGTPRRDVNCAALNGFPGFSGTTPVCYARSTQFFNLVEKENRAQFFGQAEYELSSAFKFHLEGLYSLTRVPRVRTSTSNAPVQLPTADATGIPALAGRFYVPAANPGFASYVAANPGVFPAATTGVQLVGWRAFYLGGNPLFTNGSAGSATTERRYDAFRVSGGVGGEIADGVEYDVTGTFMRDKVFRTANDVLTNRLQLALVGLGGPNCDSAPSQPGIQGQPGVGGCMYFNPFSTALAFNPALGGVNPQFNPAVTNSPALAAWLFPQVQTRNKSELFVVDGVINGSRLFTLPGGDVGWAFGGQYRKSRYDTRSSDLLNPQVTPCLATPDFFVTNCAIRNGPFSFLGPSTPTRTSGDVWAVFGELSVPLFDKLNFQLAARYEDYGGGVGSTFDPKIAGRWQALPWIALRGSYSTTFRGPPLISTDPNPTTTLQSVRSIFRAVDVYGSADLKPESATNLNGGILLETGGFRASVDYWRIRLKNTLTAEPLAAIASALYPTASTNRCGDPAVAEIQARFTFQDLNGNGIADDCAAANISRVRTNIINGSPVKTDGLDFAVSYNFRDVFGLRMMVGADATWTLSYDISALSLGAIPLSPAFDAVGKLNYQTTAYPLPEWRGQAYVNLADDHQNLRMTVRYIDGYVDQRTDIFSPSVNNSTNGTAVALTQGKNIKSWTVVDMAYRLKLPFGPSLIASIENLFNVDPPFARLNYSYDPFVANPLGTTVKFGIQVDL